MKRLILFLLIILLSTVGAAQILILNIHEIRNTKGQLRVAVFEDPAQFQTEQPMQILNVDKSGISDAATQITLHLAPGCYAITVLDDEDRSNDMSYWLGVIPREGIGFSDFILRDLHKPGFSDFQVNLGQDSLNVDVEITYF